DLVLLELLVDLRIVELFVAAELDRSDAWPLLDDGADDHAVVAFVRLDADVIEEAGLPEVQEVALDGRGVVHVARVDAEVDADRVAGDGGVAGGLEALDALAGQRVFRWRDRRRGDDAAALRLLDDRPRLRLLRLGRRSLGL